MAQFYTSAEKIYEGVIRFGFATDTYDAEGTPAGPPQNIQVSLEEIRRLGAHFQGVIEQMPPPFSAKKIHGVPAYKLARKHLEVPLQPVQVEIKEFEILDANGDHASFRARDRRQASLHLRGQRHHPQYPRPRPQQVRDGLRRRGDNQVPAVGPGPAGRQEWSLHVNAEDARADAPVAAVVATPADDGHATGVAPYDDIRNGRAVNLPELSRARQVKVFSGQRELIAIATRVAGTLFHPKIVLTADPAKQLARNT